MLRAVGRDGERVGDEAVVVTANGGQRIESSDRPIVQAVMWMGEVAR